MPGGTRELEDALAALRESEARFREMADSAPVLIWMAGPDTLCTFFNRGWLEFTGRTMAEELGNGWTEGIHPGDRDRFLSVYLGAFEQRQPFDTEYRLRRADGEHRWLIDRAVPLYRGETFAGYIGTCIDVHERRQASDRMARLQAVTARLARASTQTEVAGAVVHEGAAALNAQAGWIALLSEDESALELLASVGYKPELAEAYRSLPMSLVNPTVDAVRHARPVWLGSADAVAASYPDLDRDYRQTGFEAMAIVPLLSGARAVGILALNFEARRTFDAGDRGLLTTMATQCSQALERARLYDEREHRARAVRVLEHVGDGVFQVDEEGLITTWNRAAQNITGVPPERALGKHLTEIWTTWDQVAPRVEITREPVAEGRREAFPFEVEGREHWLAISGVAAGESTVYAFRDVTESHALEEARRDFLATASHELRTPLAAVYGAAQTLRKHHLEAGQGDVLLEMIARESERLAGILDDLLTATRLDTGMMQLSIGQCDGRSLVEEIVALEREAVPAEFELAVVADEETPKVACDRERLRQVLMNLVENAIKYSPGGGRVEVALREHDGRVRFSVADEGLGIPENEWERVFEKFYRLDPRLARGVGGTGLGLYISRELVKGMEGSIWVESELGKGSTFHVDLPVAEPVAD
ncbi:MAG: ATP-binding protein [Gaiellaceae bacterium]